MEKSRPDPIFQIGFNKCGTASIHYFLLHSRIPSHHWVKGMLAKKISERMDAGEDPIQDFPQAVGFTDMMAFGEHRLIEPYKRFEYLHHWYPDALFVLNTRDRERWIASRAAHAVGNIRFIALYAKVFRISEAEVPDFWRAEWDAHHVTVRAYFAGAQNFLDYDIERDDPRKLVAFIGGRYPECLNTSFETHNSTPPERRSTIGGSAPTP